MQFMPSTLRRWRVSVCMHVFAQELVDLLIWQACTFFTSVASTIANHLILVYSRHPKLSAM